MIWIIALAILLLLLIVARLTVAPFYDEDPDQWPDIYDTPREIQDSCGHPELYLKVLSEIVNCETTVVACRRCGKHLGKPETDCR